MNSTTYGIGGYIADHPNGNVVEQTVDNGDGTGTRTTYDTYDTDGNVTSVEQLTGLPIPEPEPPDPIAEMQATIDALLDALGGSDG